MRNSNVALRLQVSLLEEAKRVAKPDGVDLKKHGAESINQRRGS